MNLAQLTSADLKHLAQLLEAREDLQAQLQDLDRQLAAFDTAPAPTASRPTRRRRTRRTAPAQPPPASQRTAPTRAARRRTTKPGQLREVIIQLLKAAGQSGITVREIATELGLPPQRLFVWFNAATKKTREIQKLGPALYAWVE